MGEPTESKDSKQAVVLFLLIVVPFAINLVGLFTRTNPLSSESPYGFLFGFPATVWLVRRCEYHAGKTRGVPDSQTEKRQAFLFGLARIFEVITILWLPEKILAAPFNTDMIGFVVFAKVSIYLSYLYWVVRLSCPFQCHDRAVE